MMIRVYLFNGERTLNSDSSRKKEIHLILYTKINFAVLDKNIK